MKFAREHGAAGEADGGQVAGSRAHQQGGSGLVAAHEQDDAINGIAANGFLHIHAGQVAEQHGGGAKLGFTQGHDGKFEREAASLPHPALDEFGEFAEVAVAGREL